MDTRPTRWLAAGSLVIVVALLIFCAGFDPTILTKVPGLNVPIAFGGMALLYVSFKAATRKSGTHSNINIQ